MPIAKKVLLASLADIESGRPGALGGAIISTAGVAAGSTI